MQKTIFFLLIGVLDFYSGIAQTLYQEEDTSVFNSFLEYTRSGDNDIIRTAGFFLDIPYVEGTLEGDSVERLRVNLREMDCFTFMETVIALQLMLQNKDHSFTHFCSILQQVRYRDGIVDGYLSRLHYTSEWLYNNQQKGIVSLPQLSRSEKFKPELSFMSSHCRLYPALKAHPEWCAGIRNIEKNVNQYTLYYIPKEQVRASGEEIQHGDIIAITTHINGLDVSHVGFAFRKKETIHLLHASSEMKKILVSTESLHDYLAKRKNHSGIIVARLTASGQNHLAW